jgi:hypothetical protein
MYTIASVTPTLCKLMGVKPPSIATEEPVKEVLNIAKKIGLDEIERALIYAPDALGEWIYRENIALYSKVKRAAPIEVEVSSINPTWTPVCYASVFTGAKPEAHGITKYEKPVLTCDTLFDAFIRAGKRVALVAVKNSSIDLIFRGRKMDYYTEEYDPQVETRVLDVINDFDYDLIVAYHQEYDDLMHGSTPRDPNAMKAFQRHLTSFSTLTTTFNSKYIEKSRVVAFCPDHGTHIDPKSGKGSHGTDSPEDMKVRHFWGLYSAAMK